MPDGRIKGGAVKYLSVCAGIEAASVAWHHMGWEPVAFSEIEKFPSAVLAHHYPNVPNWGDMTKFKEWPDANIDVLVGGTPCQSFSVAGLRKGLDDPRGNLMLTYLAIAQRYRPQWLVWENVPGVLSSEGGRDFAALLRGLAELRYGWAYRVLDSQYFGVPQRRRRCFVVSNFRSWHRAAAVLFDERFSDTTRQKSSETRQIVANTIGCGLDRSTTDRHDQISKCRMLGAGDRRYMPVEIERLQGFPDGYTNIPWRNKPESPDGPRYKALGNSMAVPVMRWIGERINEVSKL
jgi:site-specific DNA-cytosine methylase